MIKNGLIWFNYAYEGGHLTGKPPPPEPVASQTAAAGGSVVRGVPFRSGVGGKTAEEAK